MSKYGCLVVTGGFKDFANKIPERILKRISIQDIRYFYEQIESGRDKKIQELKRAVRELTDFVMEHEELCDCELGFCCQLHAAIDSGKRSLSTEDS